MSERERDSFDYEQEMASARAAVRRAVKRLNRRREELEERVQRIQADDNYSAEAKREMVRVERQTALEEVRRLEAKARKAQEKAVGIVAEWRRSRPVGVEASARVGHLLARGYRFEQLVERAGGRR